MRSISWLVDKLSADYPQFHFTEDTTSRWSHDSATVFYNPSEPNADWTLLHELAHACLNHTGYIRDIALLQMERDAWEYAKATLAPRYEIDIDEDFIEDHLDTYRDWLHAKSTCPTCTLTGMEIAKHHYRCLGCGQAWRTNAGTQARVQRYKANTPR